MTCLAGASKMGLKQLKIKASRSRQRASGFSLLEMMMVVAITIIVALYAVLGLVPVLNQTRVNNAYNTTMAAMRQARDNAVSQRTSYSVTFSSSVTPNTIVVAPTLAGFQGDQNTVTYQLPPGVTFLAQSALATTPPPDGYGAGTAPIDFGYAAPAATGGGDKTIYFCPDGSAENNNSAGTCSGMNNWSGGVIYIAQSSNVLSSRALTLWGGTGRIHGWRLYSNGAGYLWARQ